MGSIQKSGSMKRESLKRGSKWINKKGPLTTLWDDFRAKKANKDRDENGLILCQDWKLGLPRCGIAVPSPDLHHIKGREARPDLYFADRNLVWLIRETCHAAAHNNTSGSSAKAQNDPKRPLETTPQRDAILGIQGRSSQRSTGDTRRTVYSSIQDRNASILERKKESFI